MILYIYYNIIVDQCGIYMDTKSTFGRCKLTDLEACELNQACIQKHSEDEEWGECICNNGYHKEDGVSFIWMVM